MKKYILILLFNFSLVFTVNSMANCKQVLSIAFK